MNTTTLAGADPLDTEGSAPHAPPPDARLEFRALLTGCATYNLGARAKIKVTGEDRVRWMNGMVTNNVRDLAPRHGVYAFLLNAQGRIQGDLYIYNLRDSLMVDIAAEQRGTILAHFDKFIIADDVEVNDASSNLAAIGLAGSDALSVLRQSGIDAPALSPLELCSPQCNCDCGCAQCTLVRSDHPSETAYEIWLSPDKVKPTTAALVAAGATLVGSEALELWRIAYGIPRYGVDIHDRDLPQETGQTRALSFTAGCYLGQEIVERIRSRGAVHRQFTAFDVEGSLPIPATKILPGMEPEIKEVGEITSSAILPLPDGDRSVALGYLRREAAIQELHAGSARLKPAALGAFVATKSA